MPCHAAVWLPAMRGPVSHGCVAASNARVHLPYTSIQSESPIHSSTPLVQQLICKCCCSSVCAEDFTATTNTTFLNRDWLIPPFVVMTQLFPANAGTYPQSCCLWTLHLPETSPADPSADSATHRPHSDKAAQLSVRLSPPESRHESSKQELPCRSYCG